MTGYEAKLAECVAELKELAKTEGDSLTLLGKYSREMLLEAHEICSEQLEAELAGPARSVDYEV